MFQRTRPITVAAALLLLGWAGTADARYRYGQYSAASGGGGGRFFVYLEGMVTNPRNADTVVATLETTGGGAGGVSSTTTVLPKWDGDLAGRLGFGYGWGEGNRVSVAVWGFQTDQSSAGNGPSGGVTYFAVGPPIRLAGGAYAGDQGSPGSWNLTTEIEAGTADVAYGHEYALTEAFLLEWSAGLRYASYKETMKGGYDEAATSDGAYGASSFRADKSNEGEMFGVHAVLRGSYRFAKSFSLDASLGLSFLDGELRASSSLTPDGSFNSTTTPASRFQATDDSRSGSQQDIDLAVSWRAVGDAVRVWLGWEQQVWEGITTDYARNFAGTPFPLRDRDSVTFSAYKLGVFVRF